jgi:tetratricopeptide (TPR) repeat protein
MIQSASAVSQPNSADRVFAELVEELTARLQAGEAVDIDVLAREHPEYAEKLRRLLPALEVLGELSRSGQESFPLKFGAETHSNPPLGTLGDFRIVREVGRGGMGIVYEAEQVSLNRRVALKVLPFAATLDPKQLQRFRNEAQAAAHLQHGNIVPVHFVGCERGVHFYAMQFIDGQTLAELLRQLRQGAATPAELAFWVAADAVQAASAAAPPALDPQPTTPYGAAQAPTRSLGSSAVRRAGYWRQVARLGEQAAEALQHAHDLGVIHRDVKPGNLLLDGRGNLWVTDFGLAHVQSGASLTVTGDLVGTLRYMSPEQALAQRVVIDHRTDVYSLGATLYELLTLRPAFDGTDRHELLRQIAFEEPRPPRRLDKAIPAELETIVLKALEKNPADRYSSAQELADDLRRFLDDQPIRARRPSWRQVAAKWARRHRALVWAAAAMLAVLLLLGGGFGVWRMQKRAVAKTQAELALEDADRFQAEGRWPEALWAARRAEPWLSAGLVSEGLRRRVQERVADLEMVDRLEQIRLQRAAVKEGHFDTAQADPAYAQAFADYGIELTALGAEEAAGRLRSRGIRVELAAALDDWAEVCRITRDKADTTWKDLLGLARAADPDELRNRLRDALEGRDVQALKRLAAAGGVAELPPSTLVLLANNLGQTDAVEEAVALLRQAQRRHPGDFWVNHDLAEWLSKLGPGHQEEVVRYFTVAVALRPLSPGTHLNLGAALSAQGQLDEAVAAYREAIRLKNDYAEAHYNLGIALKDKGQLGEAIAEYREAIRIKKDFALAHSNLGVALATKGQLDEAIAECRHAIQLKKDSPEAHTNLGVALMDKGQLDEAIAEHRQAIRLRKDYACAHNNLGVALTDKGQLDEAIAECRQALRLQKDFPGAHLSLGNALYHKRQLDEAIAEYREAIRLQKNFDMAHSNLGNALRDKGQLEEAIAEYRHAIQLKKNSPEAHSNLGAALATKGQLDEAIAEYREAIRLKPDFALAHNNLGGALHRKGQLDEAIAEYREAIRLKKDDPAGHGNLGVVLLRKGQFRQAAEAFRRAHQLGSKIAQQWLRDAERLADLDPRLPALLQGQEQPKDAGERLYLAQLCQEHKQLFAAAARLYAQAFADQPRLADHLIPSYRYNAACSAALAGCGQGQDAGGLDEKERARLRREALDWLRADLDAWRRLLEKVPDWARPSVAQQLVAQQMQHWQQDRDLAGLREAAALAKLPAEERTACTQLWADVAALLKKAEEKAAQEQQLAEAGKLAQRGLGLLQQQKWAEAEPLLRQCLAIREKAQPDAWTTFNTRSMLGGALLGQKKYADAEPLLLAGYEGMKKREANIPPQARPRLAEAVERLVQLYEALGKKDEVARWTREREALQAPAKTSERKP